MVWHSGRGGMHQQTNCCLGFPPNVASGYYICIGLPRTILSSDAPYNVTLCKSIDLVPHNVTENMHVKINYNLYGMTRC